MFWLNVSVSPPGSHTVTSQCRAGYSAAAPLEAESRLSWEMHLFRGNLRSRAELLPFIPRSHLDLSWVPCWLCASCVIKHIKAIEAGMVNTAMLCQISVTLVINELFHKSSKINSVVKCHRQACNQLYVFLYILWKANRGFWMLKLESFEQVGRSCCNTVIQVFVQAGRPCKVHLSIFSCLAPLETCGHKLSFRLK